MMEEFYIWMDKAPVTGVLAWPAMRAAKSIADQALAAGVAHGRVTMWLWRQGGYRVAFAMARKGGRNADRAVSRIEGPPPHKDEDKAQVCSDRERWF